jgi:predicted MFS family arabinose efflux permease
MVPSTVYVARIRHSQPPVVPHSLAQPNSGGLLNARQGAAARRTSRLLWLSPSPGRRLLRLDLLRGPFGLFIFGYLMFYAFQATPIPVLPLFWVNGLHLSDATISVGNAIFQCTMLMSSLALAPLSRRIGLRGPMVASTLLNGAYPLINGLARGPGGFLLASVMGGGVWGTANPSLVTRLFERVPGEDRPAHMALFNLAVNLGGLGGSLLGPALAGGLGLREALLAAAGLRLLAGLLLWRWG